MAAGLQVDREYLNQKVGAIAVQLRDVLDTAGHLTSTLAGYDAAGLTAAFGYSAGEAADLGDALYAMSLLVGVAHGQQTVSTPTDFRVGLSKVTGID